MSLSKLIESNQNKDGYCSQITSCRTPQEHSKETQSYKCNTGSLKIKEKWFSANNMVLCVPSMALYSRCTFIPLGVKVNQAIHICQRGQLSAERVSCFYATRGLYIAQGSMSVYMMKCKSHTGSSHHEMLHLH